MPEYAVGQRVRVSYGFCEMNGHPCPCDNKVLPIAAADSLHGHYRVGPLEFNALCTTLYCWMDVRNLEPIPEEVNHD
jgi:hypothetical protein